MSGLRLKEARKQKGLTQAEVAEMVGISQSGFSAWESGKTRIDAQSLSKLAALYGVSTDYLLGGEADKSGSTQVGIGPKTEQAAAPKGNGLSEEVARLFAELEPEDQVEVIAKICELRGRVKEK